MISVIVPVYNVENYLDKCIQSILSQSYKNFELILIEDGSTDRSKDICNKWQKIDTRITIIHQKNSGVSRSRNKGLSISKGKYIAFIDSDDWIAKDYLQTFITYVKKYDVDIIASGTYNYYNNAPIEKIQLTETGCLDFKKANQYYQMMTSQHMTSPTCKLYKKALIDNYNILFNEKINLAEDREFNLKYMSIVKTGYITSYVGYYYRRNIENSLTHQKHNTKFKYDCIHWKFSLNNYFERGFYNIDYIDTYLSNELYNIVNDQLINDSKEYSLFKFANHVKSYYPQIDFTYLVKNKNKIKSPYWKKTIITKQKLLFLFIIYKIRFQLYEKKN